MKLLFIASEAAPYAKTGGLGDVISALPRALAARGHDVLVVIPKYGSIDQSRFALRDTGRKIEVSLPGGNASAAVFVTAPAERLRYLFLASPWFDRHELYGDNGHDYRDNHKRFALLSAGALEAAKQQNFLPDVVHAHDWQTALAPLILKRGWAGRPAPLQARSLFTIHNLAYQGLYPREAMQELSLPADLFNPDALEFYGKIALIKAGLVFADKLTTVSPTYAREIVESPETGAGLHGLLRSRQADLKGILNGADYSLWSPDVDGALAAKYTAADLSGKATCKSALQKELGLVVDANATLAVAIGRLAHQKGYDVLAQAVPGLIARGAQVALLGTGDANLEREFSQLAHEHPGQVSFSMRFDDGLAHRMEGGGDLFLMPSRFEPCGLNQLYSLRYGTLPVVHAVGGLNDSIREGADGWGFRFDEMSVQALLDAAGRGIDLHKNKASWLAAQQRAMALDYSWDRAASEYESLYGELK
jgi:starch synthase